MDDLINRNTAWEEIKKVPLIEPDRMAFKLQQALWDVPTVDAAPVVHGEWIDHVALGDEVKPWMGRYECSICGIRINQNWYQHCPQCGAKMEFHGGENGTK